MARVEFQTIKAEEVKFGRNSFIEIARKIAKTEEGENEFVSLSKGFYTPDGGKRFRDSLALPKEPEVVAEIADKLKNI
ncbi:MAG: hypothetical protein QXH80_00395 [Candidatus Nanoarchaeia archaeon]